MRRRKGLLFWFLITTLVVGQIVIAVALAKVPDQGLTLVGWITGAIIPAATLLYSILSNQSVRFFVYVNRLKSILFDVANTWVLSAQWSSDTISEQTLETVVEQLRQRMGQDSQVSATRIRPSSYVVYLVPGPILELTFNEPDSSPLNDTEIIGTPYLKLNIKSHQVGYRRTEYAVKREIIPILETITDITSGASAKYGLTIEFDKQHNPFWSIFLANIPDEIVSKFFIRLNIENPRQPKAEVLVSETRIQINTTSAHVLQNLTIEFLTYEYDLMARLNHAN